MHIRATPVLVGALLSGSALHVQAQAGRGLFITPTFDTTVTFAESEQKGVRQSADLITQLRPGLQVTAGSGLVRGSLSYSANAVHHSREPSSSELQNNLNARVTAEAWPNWIYVDGTADVSRQAVSAFGVQTPQDAQQVNPNRVEVSTLRITPYARGQLGDVARYELRLTATNTDTRQSTFGDSRSTGALFTLDSASTRSLLGWGGLLSADRVAFRAGRATESRRGNVSLSLRPDTDLVFTVRGGQEHTNTTDLDGRSYANWGGSARWTPSSRTTASIETDQRYFGRSNTVLLEHRLPLSSLRFTSVRGASSGTDPNGVGQPVTAYQQLDSLLKSAIPDPVLRDQAVRDLLFAEGRSPDALVAGGVINRGTTLQRREDLAWSYGGRRLSLTLQAFASSSSTLDPTVDTLSEGEVRQRGINTSASYKLTPTNTATFTGSRLLTLGNATHGATSLKSVSGTWSNQFNRFATVSLSARYSSFASPTEPYREAAVTASLSLRY